MTRQEAIDQLSLRYSPIMDDLNQQVIAINLQLTTAQGQYSEFINQINEYYDALDKKDSIDEIIARGLPDENQINNAANSVSNKVIN